MNVSAWTDDDKQGGKYADYFANKSSYTLTNFDPDKRGFQGFPGELFLDLEQPLSTDLESRFDVVFNHTTLEHVFDVRTAFTNLCSMSRDVVIIVVPFLQQVHSDYGDYWRFSPQAIERMFVDEGLSIAYLSFNNHHRTSVYVFAIGVRERQRWAEHFPFTFDYTDPAFTFLDEPFAGCNAFLSSWIVRPKRYTVKLTNNLKSKAVRFVRRNRLL